MMSTRQADPDDPADDRRTSATDRGPPTPRSRVRCGQPRLVAFDYDGTLTSGDRPSDGVLAALARARASGLGVVLVTGRILDELLDDFPDVADHFDALVLENGAQVALGGRHLLTAPPIDPAFGRALTTRGIAHRRGLVIVAAAAADEHAIVDELARLGLECQLVRNRSELMVLPSGVNKGSGLLATLAKLGISPHDAIAVGDAENDHSLLAASELGIAVANAVDALKIDADLVLDAANGEAIIDLVDDLTTVATTWERRRRTQLTLGLDAEGAPVRIPAHPRNTIITGSSGDGKSYLAGLIAEQLVDLEYSVLVIDPEGDHIGLDALRPAVVLGDDGPPPGPDIVVGLLKRSDACVVVDLSTLGEDERADYLDRLPAAVEACRRAYGRPHWILIDEADTVIGPSEAVLGAIDPSGQGYCLVTWRPELLPRSLVTATDTVLALTTPDPDDAIVDLVAAVAGRPRTDIAGQLGRPTGQVLVATRDPTTPPRLAWMGSRHTVHLRHEHKYETEGTPSGRGFWFRDRRDRSTGAVAHNLSELEAELSQCRRDVLRHHAPLRDLSRWIDDVFHDRQLAEAVEAIEATVEPSSPAAIVDAARLDLIRQLRRRRHTPRARPVEDRPAGS